MIGQINDGGFLARNVVGNFNRVVVREFVGDIHGQRAGIAFFAVRADVGKFHRDAVRQRDARCLPHFAAETNFPAMQRVRPVVDEKAIFLAVQREFSFGDAIRVAPDGRAEGRMIASVAVEFVKTQNDVGALAGFVRHPQFRKRRAVGDDLCNRALRVAQRVLLDLGAVRQFAEGTLFYIVALVRFAALRAHISRNENHGEKRQQRNAAEFSSTVHF